MPMGLGLESSSFSSASFGAAALFLKVVIAKTIQICKIIKIIKRLKMNQKDEFEKLVDKHCKLYEVDADLIKAIITVESNWKSSAVRYESKYVYLWQPAKYAQVEGITLDTETILQKMSFGLVQLIGANARWLGYSEPLMKLLDPDTNIEYGVKYFKKKCDNWEDVKDKISAYNQGGPTKKDGIYLNQAYVDKVFNIYSGLKEK